MKIFYILKHKKNSKHFIFPNGESINEVPTVVIQENFSHYLNL